MRFWYLSACFCAFSASCRADSACHCRFCSSTCSVRLCSSCLSRLRFSSSALQCVSRPWVAVCSFAARSWTACSFNSSSKALRLIREPSLPFRLPPVKEPPALNCVPSRQTMRSLYPYFRAVREPASTESATRVFPRSDAKIPA